jgi:hypothetical protein
MEGVLRYGFESHDDGTELSLHETVSAKGLMRWAEPLIRRSFERMLASRLQGIKRVLELGNEGTGDSKSNV